MDVSIQYIQFSDWGRMELIALIIVYHTNATSEEWFCTKGASVRHGATIESCGIGWGTDEAIARANAFEAAQSEFKRICTASADCDPASQSVTPMRTDCSQRGLQFECRRMISFQQIKGRDQRSSSSTEPSHADDSRRIRRWMSKSELLSLFGEPDDIFEQSGSVLYNYRGPFCNDVCSVKIMLGRVVEYRGFGPRYTGAFD